jgi:hypothetical protein
LNSTLPFGSSHQKESDHGYEAEEKEEDEEDVMRARASYSRPRRHCLEFARCLERYFVTAAGPKSGR